ncbi:MAG: hypothetical protein DRO40_00635 [Thermoprotei archaeon]|nr:MAG: hypothetical protein DRO40_00635 [Thermoprotei archaeon]
MDLFVDSLRYIISIPSTLYDDKDVVGEYLDYAKKYVITIVGHYKDHIVKKILTNLFHWD